MVNDKNMVEKTFNGKLIINFCKDSAGC